MTKELERIPFEEFSNNLERVFERVIRDNEAILVEREAGEVALIRPVRRRRKRITRADYEAFLASAGGWKDTDVDAFLKDNDESRRLSTRPPVVL